jgi:hypothetical protein
MHESQPRNKKQQGNSSPSKANNSTIKDLNNSKEKETSTDDFKNNTDKNNQSLQRELR